MMLENYHVFLIGCVGAIAPEILRLYRLRNSLRFTWSWGYILISIVFVLLGGFVAYILEPSNNYAAFYSGVGTPFIINAITKETQEAETPKEIPIRPHPQPTFIPNPPSYVEDLTRSVEETRVDKGITQEEAQQQEQEKLQQIAVNDKKMSLKEFFRAL